MPLSPGRPKHTVADLYHQQVKLLKLGVCPPCWWWTKRAHPLRTLRHVMSDIAPNAAILAC
jgi:hypothetical protein